MNNETPSNEGRNISPGRALRRFIQGVVIGLGAVLPGVSGGVLCVIFGIYRPVMELLSSPLRNFKTHIPRLIPVILGMAAGFLGVSKLLAFLLEAYPDPSVCVFIGLIAGMLPSLWAEAGQQGRPRPAYAALCLGFAAALAVLLGLDGFDVVIEPGFGSYLFCGFCLALSVIAPGMSFSTLLMPLGLYAPFIDGLGSLDFAVVIPGALGALVTVICLARAMNWLIERYYAAAFHAIIGIVVAATLVIIPFSGFAASPAAFAVNTACVLCGAAAAYALGRLGVGG